MSTELSVAVPQSSPIAGRVERDRAAPNDGSDAAPLARRWRLDHVDAMRPLKQLGVVSTHSLLAFAPTGSVSIGAGLMLLHVSREAFLFVSACMLTYSYSALRLGDLQTFWRRRLIAVGVPYLCWTLIYFLIDLPSFHGSVGAAFARLGFLALTGYSQLYFLVVLIQFYVLFPAFLWLIRRTAGHHGLLLAASAVLQVLYVSLVHWGVTPSALTGATGTREIQSYQFYLLAGCLAAIHYERFHDWLIHHVVAVAAAFVITAGLAEAWYWLGAEHVVSAFGSSDPFQPIVVPFNVAAIALIYLIGVFIVRPRASETLRRLAHSGSDNSYTVYLSQVTFIDILLAFGWRSLDGVLPWPLVVVGGVVLVFLAGSALGGLLGRTPLARPLAGRHRASWRSLRPWFLGSDSGRTRGLVGDAAGPLTLAADEAAVGR